MRTSDMFPSRFLKAANLSGRKVKVSIDRLGQEELEGQKKWVVYFRGSEKALVLNKTNAASIEELHGDSNDWPGKTICLFPTRIEMQGKMVDAIRVAPVEATPPATVAEDVPF